jgi:hypothetical protein
MEYLILIYSDESTFGAIDWATVTADYDTYSKALADAGVMRGGQKLAASTSATTITARGGKTLTTDGPFAETREQLGGFYVIECADLDEALTWTARCPGATYGSVELRPIAAM